MSSGALTIAQFPGPVVEVHCPRCNRQGRYSRKRLVERFGPDLGLPDLLRRLAPDCPARSRPGIDPCGAIYPALSAALAHPMPAPR